MSQVQTRDDVLERLQGLRDDIADLEVSRVGLFGSFRRDEAGPDSDVDVLVEFRPDAKSYDSLYRLSALLEETLERPVELVTPESLAPDMRASILDDVDYVQGLDNLHPSHSRRA